MNCNQNKIKKISVDLVKICLNSFMNKNDKNINAISRANESFHQIDK